MMSNHIRLVGSYLRAFLLPLIGATVLFLSSSAQGEAHQAKAGWMYPSSCCSGQDCFIMGEDIPDENGLGMEPEPTKIGDYWVLSDGKTKVHKDDARISPDGLFHICRHNKRGYVIQPYEEKICLWVPSDGQ